MTASQIAELLGTLGQIAAAVLAVIAAIFAFVWVQRSLRPDLGDEWLQRAPRGRNLDERSFLSGLLNIDRGQSFLPMDDARDLLRQFYVQSLIQSRVSFWFGLIFAAIGFLFIITTVFSIGREARITDLGREFVGLVAGIIIEFVSALFLVQSQNSQKLLVDFFDRLRLDSNLATAVELTEMVDNNAIKTRLKAILALNFAGAKATDEFLASVLNIKLQSDDDDKDDTYPPDFFPSSSYVAPTRAKNTPHANGGDVAPAPKRSRKTTKTETSVP